MNLTHIIEEFLFHVKITLINCKYTKAEATLDQQYENKCLNRFIVFD